MHRFKKAIALISFLLLLPSARIAVAAEIKVLSALGIKAVMDDLVPTFERASGHRVVLRFAPLGEAMKLVGSGETADVIILPEQGIDELAKSGRISGDSVRPLARSGMAVAVRKGATKPDISTTDNFRRALLNASSITYGRGAGSEHIEKVLNRLGIAHEVAAKTVRGTAGDSGVRVANGQAELGISLLQVLLPVPGIEIVGPLPSELQDSLLFAVSITPETKDTGSSNALVDFLRSPQAAEVFKEKGLEPG
jgi:molybdate transport system substrate-binding protein